MRRRFERQGLGYVLTVHELAVVIAVDRLARTRGELHGEITVSCGLPGIRSTDGHLHQARFNLSGSSARTTLARILAQRADAPGLDWPDLLEDFCRRVLGAERVGDPVEKVGALPIPIGETYRMTPILPLDQVTILYGDGGTGKSTLAAALAVSVEQGVSVVDGWAPRKAPVLYLDWEAGRSSLNRRVRGVAMGARVPHVVTVDFMDCRRRGPLAGFAEDVARLVTVSGYGLVVVDSVGMASGTGGEGSDANESAIRLFSAFGYLGTTILAIDHVNRADADATGKRSRPYGCYSADTEVLTTGGWVRHDALLPDVDVLAYNPVTEQLAWELPTALHVYRYEGDLVSWATKASNALVTPNHRMIARPDWPSARDGAPWRFVTPDEITTADWRLVAAGKAPDDDWSKGTPAERYSPALLRLLGWWISEGSVQDHRLRLSQNTGPLADRIDATMLELGFPVWRQEQVRKTATHVTWLVNDRRALADEWADQCGTTALTKRLPDWFQTLGLARLEVLLEALVDGDGHRLPSGGVTYATSSRQLADDVQQLAILCGRHADVSSHSATYKGEPRPYYHVDISRPGRTTTTFRPDRSASRVPYRDRYVYCLTVPSGAYVTRLNGRMAIHGNSIYKSNLARATFELRRTKAPDGSSVLGLYHTKANDAELMAPQAIRVTHAEDGSIAYERLEAMPVSLTESLSLTERISALLAEGHANSETIALELDHDKKRVEALLYKYNGRRFNRLASGQWELLPEASSHAS